MLLVEIGGTVQHIRAGPGVRLPGLGHSNRSLCIGGGTDGGAPHDVRGIGRVDRLDHLGGGQINGGQRTGLPLMRRAKRRAGAVDHVQIPRVMQIEAARIWPFGRKQRNRILDRMRSDAGRPIEGFEGIGGHNLWGHVLVDDLVHEA